MIVISWAWARAAPDRIATPNNTAIQRFMAALQVKCNADNFARPEWSKQSGMRAIPASGGRTTPVRCLRDERNLVLLDDAAGRATCRIINGGVPGGRRDVPRLSHAAAGSDVRRSRD